MLLNSILLFAQEGATEVTNAMTSADPQAAVALQEGAEEGVRQGGGGLQMIIMMVLIFAVFYFFMIRPQRKQQKELQKKRDAMKKGDKVVTAGGIFGEIKEVKENTFLITVAKDVTIQVNKESVYADLTDAAQAATEEKK